MKVSVIIPVYNERQYLERAVLSALEQKQTKEIILVDDHSTDGSGDLCMDLSKKYKSIQLIKQKKNKGAAASRNLGIKKAKSTYIAFLDADDLYLSGFFNEVEKLFRNKPDADAVFGTIDAVFSNDFVKEKHLERTGNIKTGLTFTYRPKHGELLDYILSPKVGHFSIIGMVFKKEAILRTGFFDEKLIQSEDTDFIWHFSHKNTLYGLNKDIVIARRGVHAENSVFDFKTAGKYRRHLLEKWVGNIANLGLSSSVSKKIIRNYLMIHPLAKRYEKKKTLRKMIKLLLLGKLFITKPSLIFHLKT